MSAQAGSDRPAAIAGIHGLGWADVDALYDAGETGPGAGLAIVRIGRRVRIEWENHGDVRVPLFGPA